VSRFLLALAVLAVLTAAPILFIGGQSTQGIRSNLGGVGPLEVICNDLPSREGADAVLDSTNITSQRINPYTRHDIAKVWHANYHLSLLLFDGDIFKVYVKIGVRRTCSRCRGTVPVIVDGLRKYHPERFAPGRRGTTQLTRLELAVLTNHFCPMKIYVVYASPNKYSRLGFIKKETISAT
jgi:hypothetical protein